MKRLAELTWTQAEAERARDPIVLLPVGSTEAHGPHLPLGTDAILSEELARRAGAALEAGSTPVLLAPTISYALTDYAAAFTGTISVAAETATSLVADVCVALHGHGFGRVCLVNNHLEPAHVACLREAGRRAEARTGRRVAFPDQTERRWARTLSDEYKRGACHAGSYETSLVLAARPDLVHERVRAGLPPVPIDLAKAMKAGIRSFGEAGAVAAYFGDPAAGTVAEGDAIYTLLVTMVVATVAETWPAATLNG
jgi:creatinine amidohydrolase